MRINVYHVKGAGERGGVGGGGCSFAAATPAATIKEVKSVASCHYAWHLFIWFRIEHGNTGELQTAGVFYSSSLCSDKPFDNTSEKDQGKTLN